MRPLAALPPDLAAAKQAIGLVRQRKSSEATALAASIGDPVAQKLVEWALLRSESGAGFERYAAFVRANPHWPSIPLLRRRAEARLWEQRSDAATVRSFTAERPVTAKGKLALARVLLAAGDRDGAARLARDAWRSDELSERLETDVVRAAVARKGEERDGAAILRQSIATRQCAVRALDAAHDGYLLGEPANLYCPQ